MLEFDKEKYNNMRRDNKFSHQYIADYLSRIGIQTSLDTVKNWTRSKSKVVPEYEKIAALADLFGVPSLHLFTDGEKELEKNIKIELQLNPEKYRKYFEKEVRSDTYQDILDELDNMTNEQLSALRTLIIGVLKR